MATTRSAAGRARRDESSAFGWAGVVGAALRVSGSWFYERPHPARATSDASAPAATGDRDQEEETCLDRTVGPAALARSMGDILRSDRARAAPQTSWKIAGVDRIHPRLMIRAFSFAMDGARRV